MEYTDLSELNFGGHNPDSGYEGINLSSAKFFSKDFSNYDLSGGVFESCFLDNVNFQNSIIDTAIYISYVKNSNFSNANLSGVDFQKSNLENSIFNNTNLSNCNFIASDISNADLEDSTVTNTNFSYSKASNTKWTNGNNLPQNTICSSNSIGQCNY